MMKEDVAGVKIRTFGQLGERVRYVPGVPDT